MQASSLVWEGSMTEGSRLSVEDEEEVEFIAVEMVST